MAFVNKNWRRSIGDNVVNAAARIGGAGLAAYAINKMQTIESKDGKPQSNMDKTLAIMGAPGIAVVGLLGDLFMENPIVRSFCQGLYCYAAPRTIANMNDELADAFGWKHAPSFEEEKKATNENGGTAGIGTVRAALTSGTATSRPAIMNGTATGSSAIMNGVASTGMGSAPSSTVAFTRAANNVKQQAVDVNDIKGLAEAIIMN